MAMKRKTRVTATKVHPAAEMAETGGGASGGEAEGPPAFALKIRAGARRGARGRVGRRGVRVTTRTTKKRTA
jgi:hypothetical protein